MQRAGERGTKNPSLTQRVVIQAKFELYERWSATSNEPCPRAFERKTNGLFGDFQFTLLQSSAIQRSSTGDVKRLSIFSAKCAVGDFVRWDR